MKCSYLQYFFRILSKIINFHLLECDPNCIKCEVNGAGLCDGNSWCKAGYGFQSSTKTCIGKKTVFRSTS